MADEDQRRRIERVFLRRRCGWRCRGTCRRRRRRRNLAQCVVLVLGSASRLFLSCTRSLLSPVGRRADIGRRNRIIARRLLLIRMRLESRREGFLRRSLRLLCRGSFLPWRLANGRRHNGEEPHPRYEDAHNASDEHAGVVLAALVTIRGFCRLRLLLVAV